MRSSNSVWHGEDRALELAGTVALVGVGLIGGSIGLALRTRKLASEVIGVGRDQATLDQARRLGAIDRGTTDLGDGVAAARGRGRLHAGQPGRRGRATRGRAGADVTRW